MSINTFDYLKINHFLNPNNSPNIKYEKDYLDYVKQMYTLKQMYTNNRKGINNCLKEYLNLQLQYGYHDYNTTSKIPNIKQVYFNEPVTVVLWENGDKTIVRCQNGDTYSKESGLAIAIMKYMSGNKGRFNDIFKKWIPESNEKNK